MLPELLQVDPANLQVIMWFQNGDAPAHFSRINETIWILLSRIDRLAVEGQALGFPDFLICLSLAFPHGAAKRCRAGDAHYVFGEPCCPN